MIRSVEPAASDIPVYNVSFCRVMENRHWKRLWLVPVAVAGLFALTACGTKRLAQQAGEDRPSLSYEDARKCDYFFLEATRQREKGEYAEALTLYEHCLAINPHSAATMYELAQFYVYLDQVERARTLLEQTVEIEPDNFWYRQTLGAFYRSTKELDKAIEVYEQMAAQFSRSEVLMVLFELYSQQKDYANVIHTLDRLELKEGKSEQISMEKFRCYLQMDDKQNAFKEIESLSKEYPNDVRYRILLGDCFLDNDKPDEAYIIFQSVLQEEPGNAMAQLSLASYYDRMGMDSLLHAQQDTLLMNPRLDGEARVNIMRRIILQSQQDSVRVLNLFDRVLAQPQEDTGMAMLCYGYMQHLKMTDARTKPVLEKVLEIEPDNVAARYQLLMQAVRLDDYAEAVRVCEPALLYNPDELAFYYYLGISYYRTEQEDKALQVLQKGIGQTTPESNRPLISDFYSMIGDLQHSAGRPEDAYVAYDSALVYNPDNIGVLNNYAYYLSLERRDLDKAEEMSFRTVKAEPKNDTYLDTYAWILFEKGRYAEARIYIDEAMKNGGDQSATIVEHCGDIYFLLGETEAALQYWQQAAGMEHESATLEQKIRLKRYVR